MKKFRLVSALALAALMLSQASFPVLAQEQSQEAEQVQAQAQSAECRYVSSGAYGQDVELVCELDQAQVQAQRISQEQTAEGETIIYVDGKPVKVHEPADTALDFKTSLAAITTLMGGAFASILKLKNRVS
ncbi:MAG: hypothetical protein PVJ09_02325 [Candidatus Woesebacteria bacterium]|jgi:hypothetical protein